MSAESASAAFIRGLRMSGWVLLLLVSLTYLPSPSFGVGQKVSGGAWTYHLEQLQPSLNLPVIAEQDELWLPVEAIRQRVAEYGRDARVEPITITIKGNDPAAIYRAAETFAASEHVVDALAIYLKEQPHGVYPLTRKLRQKSPHLKRVIVGSDGLALINMRRLQVKFSSPSHRLTVATHQLATHQKEVLLRQVEPFLATDQLRRLRARLQDAAAMEERYFLPQFPRKMLRRHVTFRGPNCFHAAMAFQDQALLTMSRTNLRREPDHHHLMINHDELWHILNWYFYEVDPAKSPLKYGDVIVFLDVPSAHRMHKPAQYPWIIHASAYLFNEFVFSKGSKSPNTAYTIKSLAQEWQTWSRHAERLAVKVYRKNYVNLSKKSMILSRNDWLQ